jgi:DNA modification methylase
MQTDRFTAYHADTIDVARAMPDESVDYSVYSPPFASLYTYSNSPRDLGNVRTHEEFFEHMAYLIKEQFRVMAAGRNVSIHCMLLPTSKERDGYIGLRDFRGDLIRAYQSAGFIYHSEVVIWKDPVTAMQRTKALGLLHKQIKKDSCMSRQGVPDYVVTMRKPGINAKPVSHTDQTFPVARWQQYASPVWSDINPSDTLQFRSARENEDERHICPLQLGVIRRCIELWSRPDDIVWSPFMGIGSEGVCALEMGRRFVGAELKRSYYEQAVKNLMHAETVSQHDLFAGVQAAQAT